MLREKRKVRRLSVEEARAIVHAYHALGRTQLSLADEYGCSAGYVSLLVHGDARPDVYESVKAELEGQDGD